MKKNIRQFGLLLVALLVVSGTGCTSKVKKAYHEHRADKFFAAGKFDQAEIEYLNVLRNDNQDAKAYSRLGEIYYQEGRFQNAGPFLYKATTLATNDLDVRFKLGNIYAGVGKLKEARNSALYILSLDPRHDDAVRLLADVSLTQKDIDSTRATVEAFIKNGDRASYQVALGTLAFHEHDIPTAETDLKRAVTLDPKSPAALQAMGALYAVKNDAKNAEMYFKAAADLSPARSPRRIIYARFKLEMNDIAAATQILNDVVKEAPDYLPALMGLAEISLSQKKYDESQAYLTRILTRDPDDFDGLMFQSRLNMAMGQFDKAIPVLERMGKLYPQAPRVQYQLGLAYINSGDVTKAILCLNRALELDPNFTAAQTLLAAAQIQTQNPDPVIVSMSRLAQKQPQLEDAQLLLADAYRLRGRPNDALETYRSLEKSFPNDPKLPLLTGSTYMQLHDNAGARKAFERARQMVSNSIPALEELVNLDISEGNPDAAMQRVRDDLQRDPTNLSLQLLLAKTFLAENKITDAESTLSNASQMSSNNPAADILLAQLYFNTGNNAKAQASLDTGLAKNPKNISALMLDAAMNEQSGDYKKAAAAYEKILTIDPQFSPALNNLAYLYSEYLDQPDRAYDLAQNARTLLPFDPATADTLGWICLKRGSYAAALGLLQESARKMPDQPEVQFHYGMANYMTDKEDAARTAFQQALDSKKTFRGRDECELCLAILNINPSTADATARAKLEKRVADKTDDPVAHARLAAIFQRDGNVAQAIANYEAVLKTDPKNLAVMINLAGLYGSHDPAKGLAMAKTAYALAPDNSAVSHVMGQLAYQTGDFKLAYTQLQLAARNEPDSPQIQFEYARAAYNVGNIPAAQSSAQNALNLNLPAPQSADAQQLIDLINLAGNPAQAVAASQKIDAILKANPDSAPALLVQAVIKLQNADATSAATACEKILSHLPDFSPAQRLLAIIYSSDPTKTARAYDLAMKARATYPNDNPLAKATGIIIFQQGDYSRAARLLSDCADISDSDPEIYYYLGCAQLQLKQPAAKATLQKALNLKLSGPQADNARKLLAGNK